MMNQAGFLPLAGVFYPTLMELTQDGCGTPWPMGQAADTRGWRHQPFKPASAGFTSHPRLPNILLGLLLHQQLLQNSISQA